MNIFITGGTGFIGSHLVKKLLSKDYCIFCLVRDYQKGKVLQNYGVTPIFGDIKDNNLLKEISVRIDLVFHLAGILGKWNIPNQIYQDVHIKGTENLLRACIRLKIKRFIYCSSVGVLGPTGNYFADESFPYHPTSVYEYTKAEAEKLVLGYARDGKIDATIIRPAVVYGPGDFHMLRLFKAIKKGLFPLIDSGKALLQPTYIEDVIQGFDLCVDNKKTINQIYILAGEKPVTVKEFIGMITKIMGISSSRINFSSRVADVIASIFEVGEKVFLFDPLLTRAAIKFFTENKAYKIDKAVQELGYRPINLEEGLRRTIEWYQKNGYL